MPPGAEGDGRYPVPTGPHGTRWGGGITSGAVLALLAALGLTVFGIGAASHVVTGEDVNSWLYSSSRGEVARVNGLTARVDTRYRVPGAAGHLGQISQTDRYLIMRDMTTGRVSALDLSTLQVSATTATTPGRGVAVALSGDAALIVDAVQGVVRQFDPRTLTPVGAALRFPPGLATGAFDGAGRLWVGLPGEGTVAAIRPARTGRSGAPTVERTVAVAPPSHDLALVALDSGVAVLDRTAATLTTVRGGDPRTVSLPADAPAEVPARVTGPDVPVTVADSHTVYVVRAGRVTALALPAQAAHPGPAVPFGGRFYCPDPSTGTVYVLDPAGRAAGRIDLPAGGGPLELDVRGPRLYINAPDGSTARVVGPEGQVNGVDKYADGILGGDPPRRPPTPPPPPSKPRVTVPGAPPGVTASAGNASARVSWGPAAPHGAEITRYVVRVAGRSYHVGAGQRTFQVTGLANGRPYRFTVAAVNRVGEGPAARSAAVVPTSDVPAAPPAPTATAHPDGSVTVTWTAADGLGRRIVRYTVTAVTPGAQAPAGASTTTSLTVRPGALAYGTQVAFAVASVNDLGAGSAASPPGNSVVPYTVPGAPANLRAGADTGHRGTITVAWDPPPEHGRAITGYQVVAGTRRITTTAATASVDGFADGATVPVRVTAANAAGTGPAATATARTITRPTLTLTGAATTTYNSLGVTVSVNDGGSPATCTLSVTGAGSSSGACTRLSVGGLWPGRTYRYTATVRTAAGTAGAGGSAGTPKLYGTVICPDNTGGYCDSGIWAYRTPSQSGTAVNPSLRVGSAFEARCWTAGGTVNAVPWGGKRSAVWIRRPSGDYFPWAWTRLDGGDNYRAVPPC